MSAMDYPCEDCGAAPKEPCADDCPTANMSYEEWSASCDAMDVATGALIETPPEPLAVLAAAVHRLPYGGLVGIRGTGAPDRQDYEPDEYIARLATWMSEYQQVLTAVVEDLQEQSKQRIALQLEADILHRALGRAA